MTAHEATILIRPLRRSLPLSWLSVIFVAATFAVYLVVLHPWIMTWGATEDEQRLPLAGDELNPAPAIAYTRAVTIQAPPAEVWPWLPQIGQDRSGFYSYDWLENLVGAGMPRVHEIRPEWQQRAVGERIPMSRPDMLGGRLGEATTALVVAVDPGRALVTRGAGNDIGAYVLQPVDESTTRLLIRERKGTQGEASIATAAFNWLVWDPMHFVMQRRMMLGIKELAESGGGVPATVSIAATIGWAAAGGALLATFLSRRNRWPWLALPVAAGTPGLLTSSDPDAALAAFLAVGITVIGALVFGRQWWVPFAALASSVMLMLLFAPDAYIAFGLVFLVLNAAGIAWMVAARRTLRGAGPSADTYV